MVIDFKVTVWERVIVSDEIAQDIIEKIKSGEITNSCDLIDYDEFPNVKYEGIVSDTTEQMSVSENGGCSTIEVCKSNGDCIYSNDKN
jgi:hypothetical protein